MSSPQLSELVSLIVDVLGLSPPRAALTADTRMLGSMPELDSMAVVALITEIESRFGLTLADDEVSAASFETVGALYQLISSKS